MTKSLSALLSQVLVAYSIEFGYELTRRMGKSPGVGDYLSLFGWANFWQFVEPDGMSVRKLLQQIRGSGDHQLACYERWGFLTLEADPADPKPIPRTFVRLYGREERDGFGSTRGIKKDWIVRPTEKGLRAIKAGPLASTAVDRAWSKRFRASGQLRVALESIADQLDVEYPDCTPRFIGRRDTFPPRLITNVGELPLSALLSKVLSDFTMDFNRSDAPTVLAIATVLQVLDSEGVPLPEIPARTGLTRDSVDLEDKFWRSGLIALAPDPNAKRGKVARLTEAGHVAKRDYPTRTRAIESTWAKRYGANPAKSLRRALEDVMSDTDALRAAVRAPDFSVRSPKSAPAAGQTGRDRAQLIVEQNEAFVRDPAGALPHYPIWALTHGFEI